MGWLLRSFLSPLYYQTLQAGHSCRSKGLWLRDVYFSLVACRVYPCAKDVSMWGEGSIGASLTSPCSMSYGGIDFNNGDLTSICGQ